MKGEVKKEGREGSEEGTEKLEGRREREREVFENGGGSFGRDRGRDEWGGGGGRG